MLLKTIKLRVENIKNIFFSPINTLFQKGVIITVALAFIFMPQHLPNDWALNTEGFWSSFPNSYANPNHVYPPWGLILMLPYYWMRAEGVRIISVFVIGWLAQRKSWSLSQFLSIILSPYFLVTMTKSNIDIFVLLLPILLWEISDGKRWQNLGWGIAMSLALLKPQGMVFIWLYWLWSSKNRFRELLIPLVIMTFVTVPISIAGSPPLFLQWLDNIIYPSAQNIFFWSSNNLSMTSHLGLAKGLSLVLLVTILFFFAARSGRIHWTSNHTYASLIFYSFFLMPYTSQQSFSSAIAFLPSWLGSSLQWLIIIISLYITDYEFYMPWFVFTFAIFSLLLYQPRIKQNNQ